MRHQKKRHRLGLKPAHARMVRRNLITSLVLYESIRTTKKRASVIQPEIDKLVAYAKSRSPHIAIRHMNKTFTDKNASRKVMEVLIKRYAKRPSGLTRIIPAGYRQGDGAEVVDIELVDAEIGQAEITPKNKQDEKDGDDGKDGKEKVSEATTAKSSSQSSQSSKSSESSKKKPATKKKPVTKKKSS